MRNSSTLLPFSFCCPGGRNLPDPARCQQFMKDVPPVWMHSHDELYHGQRGPAQNMTILATAYSSEASGGTGQHEPMIWWIPYEKGKVLTFLPGHLWPTQPEDTAYQCVGLRTLLQRSAEWLATGQVTVPIPDSFPTAEEVSLREE